MLTDKTIGDGIDGHCKRILFPILLQRGLGGFVK